MYFLWLLLEAAISIFNVRFLLTPIFCGRVNENTTAYGWTVRGSNPGEAIFSAPVQTGPEAHSAYCTKGTGSFPGVRCCRGVTLTPF